MFKPVLNNYVFSSSNNYDSAPIPQEPNQTENVVRFRSKRFFEPCTPLNKGWLIKREKKKKK